jgi:hypothetical protein
MTIATTTTHELKTWPPYFEAIEQGIKTFELRRDDRGFKALDWLHLREFDPMTGTCTGREHHVQVLYILDQHAGLTPGFVILGLDTERLLAAGLELSD